MMIFKETILLESAAALLGVVGLVVGGLGAAPTGAQDGEEDAGETGEDETGVAVSVAEVEADVGEIGVAVNGAAVDEDKGEAGTVVNVELLEEDVQEADSGVTERVDPG